MPGNQGYFWCTRHLIFIWCHLRWRVWCWSFLLCVCVELVCRGWGRQGPDETPSGQTPHPANSHPSGLGLSPLISSHQRVPAHQRTLSWLPAWKAPSPYYRQKDVKAGSPSIIQPPAGLRVSTSHTDYTVRACGSFLHLVKLSLHIYCE